MDRPSSRFSVVETILWIIASLAAFAAFLVFAPSFFTAAAPTATPAAVSLSPVTPRPSPTLTPLPTSTGSALLPQPKTQTLPPTPTLAPGAQAFEFVAEPKLSGWAQNDDSKPHFGDRNLHAGAYKGQVFQALLYFDLTALAPGTKILYARVELTGLSRDNIGASGEWTLRMLKPDLLAQWKDRTSAEFYKAPTLSDIGAKLKPEDLTAGQLNPFVLSPNQRQLVEQALETSGIVTFRLTGDTGGKDSLFTWDNGGLDLKVGAHPILRLVAIPSQFTIITNTPKPENVLTAAVQVQTATAFATRFGTATPFPRQIATATPLIVVTPPPTPENIETVIAQAAYATAVALTTGTFTPTPLNWITATPVVPTWTPLPTATPPVIPLTKLTPYITNTPVSGRALLQTPVPNIINGIPFKGNIVFYSSRYVRQVPLVMKPDGTLVGALSGPEYYDLAYAREWYSPDRSQRAVVMADANGILQIWIEDLNFGSFTLVTHNVKGIAYDPAWSPDGTRIVYVSTETGIAEIYVYDIGQKVSRQLTFTDTLFVFNQRPTWSPDNSRLVYKSNRDTERFQIWIMNADGSNQHILSASTYNDVDPIWVK